MTRVNNRPALVTALTVAALGLAACDDAQWLIAQAKKGGASADPSGGAKPDPLPPPPTECKSASQGGPTSCKDAGTWKAYASEACVAAGATLGDYLPYEDCGNGGTRYVKYTCCPAVPPPPPPPTECTTASQGGPTSCKDVGTWKSYAYEACVAAGATLTDYSTSEDCGNGNTRYVKYTCCSAKAPAPVK